MRKRLRLCLLALVTALVTAEGLLQLGYFLTWRFLSPTGMVPADTGSTGAAGATGASGQRPVLLTLGDSFTYGVGAATPEGSYPAQLGRGLQQDTGRAWRVANRGWPGRCSRELLESVDAWLAESKPEVVCICVGVNDTWQLPDELVLPPVGAGANGVAAAGPRVPYVWTCRLWRLLTTLRSPNPFRDHGAPAATVPDAAAVAPTAATSTAAGTTVAALVGDWQVQELGQPLRLLRDGTGVLGDLAIRWYANADTVTLLVPPQAPLLCSWQRSGDAVELRLGSAATWRLRRQDGVVGPAPVVRHDRAGEGRAAIDRRDWAEAISAFAAALQDRATDPSAEPAMRAALVQAHTALQHEAAAQAELQTLRRLFEQRGDTASAEGLVQALVTLRREAEALTVLEAALRVDLPSPALWAHLARLTGDRARARHAIDRAIAHAEALGWRDLAFLCREKARLHGDDADAAVFAEAAVRAWLDEPSRERQRQVLAYRKGDVEAMVGPLQAACVAHGLDAETTAAMVGLLREAKGALPPGWQRTYRSHLRQVLERCRGAGAEPVLVGYPFRFVAQDLQQQLAEEQHVLFVPMDGLFAAVKASQPQRVLFVADGHCNEDGYGLMAAEVRRSLLAWWASAAAPADGAARAGK